MVYCKYNFLGQPKARATTGRPHMTRLYWNDTYVMLTGTLDQTALREYLARDAFVIEVHDRDRKAAKRIEKPPALFGNDPEDERINSSTYVSGVLSFFYNRTNYFSNSYRFKRS